MNKKEYDISTVKNINKIRKKRIKRKSEKVLKLELDSLEQIFLTDRNWNNWMVKGE